MNPLDRALANRIESALTIGRLDEAASLLDQLKSRIKPPLTADYDHYQAYYLASWGDLAAAAPLFRSAFERLLSNASTAADHIMRIGSTGAYYSISLIWGGQWHEAGEICERSIARTAQHPDYLWLADDWSRLCLCYLRQGRMADADRALQQAYTYMGGMSPEAKQAEAQMIEREYARAEGRFHEALALSLLILESGKPKPYRRWLYADLAEMYLERNQFGDRAEAIRLIGEARRLAAEMGADGWVAIYEARIAELAHP